MVALLAALITGTFGALTYSDTFLRAQQRTRRKLVAEIRQRVGPGETVQMMDLTYGGLHALMETGAHQPTAMLYDFPLYESSDHPYVQSLRKRFLAELKARPPKLIVVFRLEGGWSAQGFDRPNRFPELDEWMQRTYSVEDKADRFWLYQRRPGVPAAKRSEND